MLKRGSESLCAQLDISYLCCTVNRSRLFAESCLNRMAWSWSCVALSWKTILNQWSVMLVLVLVFKKQPYAAVEVEFVIIGPKPPKKELSSTHCPANAYRGQSMVLSAS